jgi:hypothetical protein
MRGPDLRVVATAIFVIVILWRDRAQGSEAPSGLAIGLTLR